MIFGMYLIGTIFVLGSTVWAYWTSTGGILMLIIGVFYILIAKDIQDQKEYEEEERKRAEILFKIKKLQELEEAGAKEIGPEFAWPDSFDNHVKEAIHAAAVAQHKAAMEAAKNNAAMKEAVEKTKEGHIGFDVE